MTRERGNVVKYSDFWKPVAEGVKLSQLIEILESLDHRLEDRPKRCLE